MQPLCGVLVGAGSASGHWLIHIGDETGIREGSNQTGGQRQDDFVDNFVWSVMTMLLCTLPI
jgi:hypothetical protein